MLGAEELSPSAEHDRSITWSRFVRDHTCAISLLHEKAAALFPLHAPSRALYVSWLLRGAEAPAQDHVQGPQPQPQPQLPVNEVADSFMSTDAKVTHVCEGITAALKARAGDAGAEPSAASARPRRPFDAAKIPDALRSMIASFATTGRVRGVKLALPPSTNPSSKADCWAALCAAAVTDGPACGAVSAFLGPAVPGCGAFVAVHISAGGDGASHCPRAVFSLDPDESASALLARVCAAFQAPAADVQSLYFTKRGARVGGGERVKRHGFEKAVEASDRSVLHLSTDGDALELSASVPLWHRVRVSGLGLDVPFIQTSVGATAGDALAAASWALRRLGATFASCDPGASPVSPKSLRLLAVRPGVRDKLARDDPLPVPVDGRTLCVEARLCGDDGRAYVVAAGAALVRAQAKAEACTRSGRCGVRPYLEAVCAFDTTRSTQAGKKGGTKKEREMTPYTRVRREALSVARSNEHGEDAQRRYRGNR